jgi:serine/threonine protein kinase
MTIADGVQVPSTLCRRHDGAHVNGGKVSWNFEEGEQIVPGRLAVHLLGGGTRAEAWVAWDERLHALVVAKILRPDRVDEEGARAALAREARALGTLQHPAIVRCFEAVLDGARPHLVLESLDGPRLSTLIRRFGPLAAEQLVPLGLELCSALAFMHNSGFVHLDLKPRNVIMAASPRLIDLGIARSRQEIGALSAVVGTDAYMAPEQCRAVTIRSLGPAADIWGLGVTLYVAATGQHPFAQARSEADPHPQLSTSPAPLDARVPAVLAGPILGCLDRDPSRRPTAAQLSAVLEPLLADSRLIARRRLHSRRR